MPLRSLGPCVGTFGLTFRRRRSEGRGTMALRLGTLGPWVTSLRSAESVDVHSVHRNSHDIVDV
jgi:hypothetical protein